MVVGQGVTSQFFDFGVVGRCFKQRWGHLGGVFFGLGVRGGRTYAPQDWKCPMARVRCDIYFCFLVFESLGVFLTAFCLSFSRAFLYKAFWVLETAS